MGLSKFEQTTSKLAPKVCPKCQRDVTNGVGPSALPGVTKLLNHLPSSHLFRRAADWHDYGYHIGMTEAHRKAADDYFYYCMLADIKTDCIWFLRPWYRIQAYRNYVFVRKFGSHFFNYRGCTGNLSGNSDQ